MTLRASGLALRKTAADKPSYGPDLYRPVYMEDLCGASRLALINGPALLLQLHTPYLHFTFAISHSTHIKHTAFCPCAQLST